jgi:hypothetical protein
MKEEIVTLIRRLLRYAFSYLSKAQLDMMAEIVVALFNPGSFTLRDISSRLLGNTNVKHKLKRLQNFLDNFNLDVRFWRGYVSTVFALPKFKLRKRPYITLALDATSLREDFYILAASVTLMGRAVPVYVKIWKGYNINYDFMDRLKGFLTELKSLLPEKYKYEIVADRGFQGKVIYEIIRELEWDFVIRINSMYRIKTCDGGEYVQLSLFEDGFYEAVTAGKEYPFGPVNLAVNGVKREDGEENFWYLLTTIKDRERTIMDYSRRFWIEESFKDLKSTLRWETYTRKIPEKARLEKLIVLSCISYSLTLSIGLSIDVPESEMPKTSIAKRFQHAYVNASRMLRLFIYLVTTFSIYFMRYVDQFIK